MFSHKTAESLIKPDCFPTAEAISMSNCVASLRAKRVLDVICATIVLSSRRYWHRIGLPKQAVFLSLFRSQTGN
jgi:hypothetical protein